MALSAVCVFVGQVIGTIIFTQQNPNELVSISGELKNLNEGLHGFHVHEYGDVRNKCMSAGSHYNPFHKEHAGPNDENRHVGDFGNIRADISGVANVDIKMSNVQLSGENTIVGRALMVHSLEDDLGKGGNDESKKTGNAGARMDCCVIGIAKSD